MKRLCNLVLPALCLLLSSCKPPPPACPPVIATPQNTASHLPAKSALNSEDIAPPQILVKIGGKMTNVDRIIRGPLCDDSWKGTIYVACDVQVTEWEEQPTFFKECNLEIVPGSVVYVAAHNDSAYYNGCSCHTGEESTQ